jgi:DNA-binding transcriptional LysR family regulator
LESSRALLADVRAAAEDATGILRVIEPIGMPLHAHAQTILATHGALPKLRIFVRHVEDPLAHLREPCELIVHEGAAPEKGTWFSRVIARQRLRVLASPAYLRAHGAPQRVSDLADHEIIGWKRPGQPWDAWPLVAGGTVKVSPWFVSPNFSLVRALASQGAGLLLAPQWAFLGEPESDPLVPVLDDYVGCDHVFRASSPNPILSDPRTRAVLEQVQKVLASFPEE